MLRGCFLATLQIIQSVEEQRLHSHRFQLCRLLFAANEGRYAQFRRHWGPQELCKEWTTTDTRKKKGSFESSINLLVFRDRESTYMYPVAPRIRTCVLLESILKPFFLDKDCSRWKRYFNFCSFWWKKVFPATGTLFIEFLAIYCTPHLFPR